MDWLNRDTLNRLRDAWQRLVAHAWLPSTKAQAADGPGVEALLIRCQERSPAGQSGVLGALQSLIGLDYGGIERCLLEVLEHPAPAVRRLALEALPGRTTGAALEPLRQHLDEERDAHLRALTILLLCQIAGAEMEADIRPLLDDTREPIQRAALIGLLRHGGLHASHEAMGRVRMMLRSAEPQQRCLAVTVLGQAGITRFYRPLVDSFSDEQQRVRRASLEAASHLIHPGLVPPLLERLTQPGGYSDTARALLAHAEYTLPLLADSLEEQQPQAQRARLLRVLAQLPQSEALALLETQLNYPDALIRQQVLEALQRRAQPVSQQTREELQQQLREEASQLVHGLRALEDLDEGPRQIPLSPLGWPGWRSHGYQVDLGEALETDLHHARQRLLLMLGLLDSSATLGEALRELDNPTGTPQQRTLQCIERVVPADSRALLMPLLRLQSKELIQPVTRRNLLAGLRERFRSDTLATTLHALNQRSRLSALVNRPTRYSSLWSRLCALCVLAHQPGSGIPGELLGPARNPGPRVLRETALGLLFRHYPDTAGRVLEPLCHDPDPRIAALVTKLIHGSEHIMLLDMEKAIILGNTRLFSRLSHEQCLELAAIAREISIQQAQVLIQPGDPPSTLYVVAEGSLQVDIPGMPPFRRGAVVGELNALARHPGNTTVKALEDSLLLGLERGQLLELMAEHRDIMEAVIEMLCERVSQ